MLSDVFVCKLLMSRFTKLLLFSALLPGADTEVHSLIKY